MENKIPSTTSFHDDMKRKKPVKEDSSSKEETKLASKENKQDQIIEILPPEVIIKDIETNQTYEVVMFVRNLTKTARRIRIFQPKTTKFRCDYDMQKAIAPGLAMRLSVSFETSTLNDYHDSIRVVSDGGYECEVPLHAYMPQANIIFDPFVNFGFVQLHREKTETIWFFNDGKRDGVVDLSFPEKTSELRLEKARFNVKAGDREGIKITYQPKDAGILRGRLLVSVSGQSVQKEIDLSATSVDFFVFVIDDNGNQSSSFDFGDVYYGQNGVVEAYLVNNSPKKYNFKTKFLEGLQASYDEAASLQTPNQLGIEQTQRIMHCFPASGVLDSYSQIALKFTCKPAVTEKQQYWTRNYASVSGNYHMDPKEVEKAVTYSCFFEMDGREDNVVVHLNARAVCPMIKLSHTILDFGECAVNERKDFLFSIDNKNPNHPVPLEFSKISQYNTVPKSGKIMGGELFTATITFEPHNLGKFVNDIEIILFGAYVIPIKVIGVATKTAPKETLKRGPEALPIDFEREKKFVDPVNQSPISRKKERKPMYASMDSMRHKEALAGELSGEDTIPEVEKRKSVMLKKAQQTGIDLEKTGMSDKLGAYFEIYNNKQKYNEYLQNLRVERGAKQRESLAKAKFETMKSAMLEKNYLAKNHLNEEVPFDSEFWFRIGDELPEPRLHIKEVKDPLYVEKPIGKYEPMSKNNVQVFNPDPKKLIKKKFHSKPNSNAEDRDINLDLNSDMMQKIFTGPIHIDFGSLYVKSKEVRCFSIRNELRSSILVEVNTSGIDELSQSDTEPQIIPTMQTGGFNIVFTSAAEMSFRQYITYYINRKYRFKFLVTALVEPVQLDIDRDVIRFSFADTNMEMVTYETIKIRNDGNAPGEFKWLPCMVKLPTGEDHRLFYVEPDQGVVPAGAEYEVRIVYHPSGRVFKGEDGQVVLKITDGREKIVKCTGFVLESRCVFKGVSGTINVGEIPVGQTKSIPVYLQNTHKNPAVFHIGEKLPPGVHVSPPRGRITADQIEAIMVTIQSNQEQSIKFDLVAYIRGGIRQSVTIQAQVVVPRVIIKEDEFDFGDVLLEHTGESILTIYNESNIKAHLNVDLRERVGVKEKMGVECLEFYPISESGDDESSVMVSIVRDDDDHDLDSLSDDDRLDGKAPSDAGDDSDEDEKKKVPSRLKQITIKPKSQLQFKLKFTPKEPISYMFELPIMLEGYGKIESLMRNVICNGLKPKFILKPPTLTFKKKIIKSVEKPYPDYMDVIIENKENRTVSWSFDTREIDHVQVFSLQPTEGQIKAGETIVIRAGFSPVATGDYEVKVPVYLDEKPQAYTEMTLKGQGAHPKLLFDRREVILPISPIDIEAKAIFKVINDGFENLTLEPPKVAADVGSVPLEFKFLDGDNLGITKSKVRVEVSVKLKKTMSFTTRIEFVDDEKHVYPIMISGTVDNSLLTNFPYLQRHWDEYELECPEGEAIRIKEIDDDDASQSSPRGGSVAYSKSGTQTSGGGAKGFFGYSPIPQHMIERSTEHIVRWLNFNVLTNNIARYPQDVMDSNGGQIFELLTFLTGKNYPFKARLEGVTKKSEKIKIIYKQYDDLLRNLKENGALLNTFRPEFLLKMQEYNFWLKSNPSPLLNNTHKLSEKLFNYLSCDAWITLFFQILKIYYLGRVTPKAIRSLPGIPPEKITIPQYYIEGSNIYSVHENLLLRWIEIQYETVKVNQYIRLKNFDVSLKDGTVFAALLQSYMGTGRLLALKEMRNNPQTEDDFRHNSQKIIDALSEMRLQTHFTAKDLMNPSQREMVLFCLYLYNNLPHYISKATVEFSCVLGDSVTKYIELSNPTSKAISYRVELENERKSEIPDFSTEVDEIKLEPKSMARVPVTFQSKISEPVRARIIFTNKKESNTQAAAIAFDLVSKITGRVSRYEVPVSAKLYQLVPTEIKIENPFLKPVNFQIQLTIEEDDRKEDGKKSFKQPTKKPVESKKEIMPPAFFVKQDKIPKTQPGGSNLLTVFFCPFMKQQYKCHIVFVDENVGEMQYTLIGSVEDPEIIPWDQKVTQFRIDGNNTLEIPLQFKNKHLEEAKRVWRAAVRPALRDEYDKKVKNQVVPDQITFEIENPSQFILAPPTFTIADPMKPKKGQQPDKDKKALGKTGDLPSGSRILDYPESKFSATQTSSKEIASDNKLTVELAFRSPVPEYRTRLIFRNAAKTDIRIYEITIQIIPKPIQATLEFRVPARQKQVQPIPIVNRTEKDWQIKIEFSRPVDKHGDYFNGPRDTLVVKKGKTEEYRLTFEPKWITTKPAQARLVLKNPWTNDVFDYELLGYGEEPLSEGHRIVKCKARQTKEEVFEVPNPYNDEYANYTVETDLPENWVTGKQSFSVPVNKVGKYRMQITPNLGGVFTGSITFKDQRGAYYWWTVEIQTESPKAEKSFDLFAEVRKKCALEVMLVNPLNEIVNYEVAIQGDSLSGDSIFTVMPNSSKAYELVFSPMKPMNARGTIAFLHEKLGEVWYELNLVSKEGPPIRLNTQFAELGKSAIQEVELENPSNKLTTVRYKITNPLNFDVLENNIEIPPQGVAKVQLQYSPSGMEQVESGEILFESDDIGRWQFLVFGRGQPPTKFEEKVITGTLNKDSSGTILFKNPFKDGITVSVSLQAEGVNREAFELLLKKNTVVVNGLNVFQIPFTFLPRAISDYFAELVVTLNEKIAWRYPIRGVTESFFNNMDFSIRATCRMKYEDDLKIELPGLGKADPNDTYTLEVTQYPKDLQHILSQKKWLDFKPKKTTIENLNDKLLWQVHFAPLKPMKAYIEVAINKSSGGRWKYHYLFVL